MAKKQEVSKFQPRRVPKAQIDAQVRMHGSTQQRIVSQSWTGPLPPPAALVQFNDAIPNGADRIMSMVEREQAHRIDYESKRLKSLSSDFKRGHYIGGLVCLCAIGGAVYTAVIGAPAAVSIALVSVPVLGMIKAFIPNRDDKPKEKTRS
jgi:uncharacterized membrane protein